jgi:hypothetical protein
MQTSEERSRGRIVVDLRFYGSIRRGICLYRECAPSLRWEIVFPRDIPHEGAAMNVKSPQVWQRCQSRDTGTAKTSRIFKHYASNERSGVLATTTKEVIELAAVATIEEVLCI